MKELFKKNKYFFVPYFLTLIVCITLLIAFSKPQLHIFSNKVNTPSLDVFFKYITHLGDGSVIAVLTAILFFIKYRYAIAFLTGGLLTSGIINFMKRVVFTEAFRPSKYFELYESYQLHLVEGVKVYSLYSFPSGHTGTAFNVFFMLALIIENKLLKTFFFVCAALVGYSRVYISQHFLADITVGSLIGVSITFFMFAWMEKSESQWLNKSLISKR